MAQMASFVLETATNPGTGSFTLNGAPSDRVSFAGAFPNGGSVYYFADDGTQAEWGVGTLTVGNPNTLARTTVIGTTAGGTSALKFSGAVNVYNEVPGERLPTLEADGSLLIGPARGDRVKTTATAVQFGYSLPDVDGFRDWTAVTVQNFTMSATSLRFDIKAILSFASQYSAAANEYIFANLNTKIYLLDSNGNASGSEILNQSDGATCTIPAVGKFLNMSVAAGLTVGKTYSVQVAVKVVGAQSGTNPAGRLSGVQAVATVL